MCGIAGWFGAAADDCLQEMLDAIVHRGPDDESQVKNESFGLGVRRLSIVDVAHGRQPITNESSTVWGAQNGELYNYRDVRRDLLARGHQLHTTCDTEIVPHRYEEYGADLVHEIDGMFAVAIWDDTAKVGLLARDRVGKKPLYYRVAGDVLYFASEIKALLRIPGFVRTIDRRALHHYLSWKHVPHPWTIFEGIRVLPPAHRLIFRPGQAATIERYWRPEFRGGEFAESEEESTVDQLIELLRRGVERRLMGDVPIGFFLSGGIDSSLTTALAAEMLSNRIQTFTLTYADDSGTEGKSLDRHWAHWVSKKYNTEHRELSIRADDFPGFLQRTLGCFDEPFAGTISTYLLAQFIGQHVKVALSGDGADELFGSYLSHRLAQPLAAYEEFRQSGNTDLIRPFQESADYLESVYSPRDWEWRSRLFVMSEAEKRSLYSAEMDAATRDVSTVEETRRAFEQLTASDPLNRVLEFEFNTLLPDQVLTFVDRLSMAHSLEIRSPFLDTQVVEFMSRIPGEWKIRRGETKYLLKQAARKFFPEEMVSRPKEGFLMPVTDWILGSLETYVRDTLSSNQLGKHGLFNADRVQCLIDELYQDRQPADYRKVNKVLVLLVFQEWYDLYMCS